MNLRSIALTAAVLLIWEIGAQAQPVTVEAISRPSADKTLSFVRPGQIEKIFVDEGYVVKPGQPLVKLDDRGEFITAERFKAESEDTIRIQAAQAKYKQKQVELKRIFLAKEKGVATDLEVETAQLEVVISKAELELQEFETQQAIRKYKEAMIQVEQMTITCPTDRKDTEHTSYLVEEIILRTGESADRLAKVMRIVKIDPLWIDSPVLLSDLRRLDLKVGQTAKVYFPGSKTPVSGKVIFVAAVADAASSTLTVRVEVPNKQNRPGGEYLKVEFEKQKAKRLK